jgi:hypothetical protein
MVSSDVRATAIPGASGGGAPRRVIGGDAPLADWQARMALPNRTSGGGDFLGRASGSDSEG